MKNVGYILWVAAFLVACQSKNEEKSSNSIVGDGVELVQKANYSRLFSTTKNDCPLLTAAEIADLLELPLENVSQSDSSNPCSTEIRLQDGSKYSVVINSGSMSQEAIISEIKRYREAHTPESPVYQISETGDNYICHQRMLYRMFIYNPQYEGFIVLNFNSVNYLKKEVSPLQQRVEHTYRLANALIEKYGE